MPHAVSMPATGLQAIILCGPGSSFPTFTANPDENPKALLPIANRPMVWYPIDFCYRTGVTDITLICPPSAAPAISTALNTNPHLTSLPHPRPVLLAPQDLHQNTGTAEILRLPEVRRAVTSNFVILPCDLVCELGGDKLLQAWMVKTSDSPDVEVSSDRAAGLGGLGVWYDTKTDTPVKGEETDFIATSPMDVATNRPTPKDTLFSSLSYLQQSMPTDSLRDLTDAKAAFPIRHGLLRKSPKLRMLTSHRDAHIYILPRWILDFVQDNERLETIGEDVIGWWAKIGWQDGLFEKFNMRNVLGIRDVVEEDESTPVKSNTPAGASSPATPGSTTDDSAPQTKLEQPRAPPMLAYIHPSGPGSQLIRRVDTAPLLLSVSLQLAKIPSLEETGPAEAVSPFAHAKKVAYPEGVKPKTTITRQDSLVAENVMVEGKTSIKETVVGANCQIREGAKLFQCLLMDGVVVGKGCKLTRCILGKRSEIGEGSTLTECEVQENLLVEPKTEDKDNKLMSSSGLEASEQEMEEALQDVDMEGNEDVDMQ